MRRRRVTVTKTDVLKGVRRESCFCPVALALKRAFPGKKIDVRPSFAFIGVWRSLPLAVTAWIIAYDNVARPSLSATPPFSFLL